MISLLEEKLKNGDTITKGLNSTMTLGLSRILIRNPKQEIIRETLNSSLRTQARKMSFEELHSSLYALKQAYTGNTSGKDAGLQAKYKQLELDVLQQMKDGGAKTRNVRVLAERLLVVENAFKGNVEAQEVAQGMLTQFNTLFEQNKNSINKTETVDLILRSFARIQEDTNQCSVQVIKALVSHQFGSADALKNTPTGPVIDLFIFLQRPNTRFNWLRQQVMALIQERLKNLPDNQLENYVRRVVNIEDTTPVNDVITVIQGKRILEFLDSQENTSKITPPKIYQLIERIINDSKLSTAASKTEDSFSKLFEKHRIEQNINLVMNKLDNAQITEQFIESLVHSSINLSETPNFYQKIIKRAITQGVPPTKKTQEVEGETATPPVEEAKDENVI